MKLVVAVMHADDATSCTDALSAQGFPSTRLDSRGGFLERGNSTLICGVADEQVQEVVEILRAHSKSRTEFMSPVPPMVDPADAFVPYPVEVEVGGVTVFVLNVDRFEKL